MTYLEAALLLESVLEIILNFCRNDACAQLQALKLGGGAVASSIVRRPAATCCDLPTVELLSMLCNTNGQDPSLIQCELFVVRISPSVSVTEYLRPRLMGVG